MKISLEWLSEFLPGPLDAHVAAEALTHGGLPVESIEKVGNDTVIDVEVTSNRGDCLSHIGVARELAALLNRQFKEPSFSREGIDDARQFGDGPSRSRRRTCVRITRHASFAA